MEKSTSPNYEALKARLSQVLKKLSDSKKSIDEMMALYEEGAELIAKCQALLSEYSRSVEAIDASFNILPGGSFNE